MVVAFGVAILGMFYIVVMVFLAFSNPWRRFALWTGLLAVVVTFTAMIIAGDKIDKSAKAAGFLGAEDQRNAGRAGITDAATWRSQREAFLKRWEKEKLQKEAAARATEERQSAQTNAICRKNFDCWTGRFERTATSACAPLVERSAKNNFDWTDSFSSPKFPRAVIKENGAVITYVGDAIKMQNGFGAWIIMTYECDFETEMGKAIAVRVKPGQLPK